MLLALVNAARAQEPPPLEWEPIVELRGRVQVLDDDAPTRQLDQRARLGLEASRGILSARVSMQEVRSWVVDPGEAQGLSAFRPEVAEGWTRIAGQVSPAVGATLTLGRQAVVMTNGRLIGARDWDEGGQFLDAFRLQIEAAPVSFEYVNARRFSSPEEDPLGLGVNAVRLGAGREGPTGSWGVDGLSVVDARDTEATVATVGVYAALETGRLAGTGEAYVQGNPAGAASLVALEGAWTLGREARFVIEAGVAAASGDRPDAPDDATFQRGLGDTHPFWGNLDIFASDTDERGLLDLHGALRAHPTPSLTAKLAAHRFSTATDGLAYGTEVDLELRWHVSPFGAVGAGWGTLFAGPARERGASGGYVELDVRF